MANSKYRISVVVAELGERESAESNMEHFVDAFDGIYPDAGAVMAANYRLETLDATFTLEAANAREASDMGGDMFCEAANKTGIEPTEILEIQATLIAPARHEQLTGELSFV
ncbi:MAG TPA: hypothetical protein VFS54_11940 [Solirubrobacterales bacterium]|nr:hypothetical protein [Solirubrobacterales bacterium]